MGGEGIERWENEIKTSTLAITLCFRRPFDKAGVI